MYKKQFGSNKILKKNISRKVATSSPSLPMKTFGNQSKSPENFHNDNDFFNEDRRNDIKSQSYIGIYGFTIPKTILTDLEMKKLRESTIIISELNSPFQSSLPKRQGLNSFVKSRRPPNSQPNKIQVLIESAQKIFLPRFHGEKIFHGLPKKILLPNGDDITPVSFLLKLTPFQKEIVETFGKHIGLRGDNIHSNGGGAVIQVHCGAGKTVMAIYIITEIIRKKTIIFVNADFLAEQWKSRIITCAPGCKVGLIQGPIFDIENKDIVLVSIQTVYNRNYPPGTFDSFGFTIVDETHRACSQEYHKIFHKISTKYMLGLSATVERKTGFEKILFMYLGKHFKFEETNPTQKSIVTVRAIEYKSCDPNYTYTEYDNNGNIKYSQLVSQISSYQPRTDFIVRILIDLINDNPQEQIIVLSFTKSLLNDIFIGLSNTLITVGYYVGGMKQIDLKTTEGKQIILATYSMAAEALDIPTLNTLLMATPKTDIDQCVGRILRKYSISKTVIDLVDSHGTFQGQWRKRKAFFKTRGYGINYTDSDNYLNMKDTKWRKIVRSKIQATNNSCINAEDDDSEDFEESAFVDKTIEYGFD